MDNHENDFTSSKAEKFVELANKRVNKALKDLQLIGNLANKRNYTYSDAQAKKIISALQKEVNAVKHLFEGDNDNKDNKFSL